MHKFGHILHTIESVILLPPVTISDFLQYCRLTYTVMIPHTVEATGTVFRRDQDRAKIRHA
jgi:hypothetical protein